MSDEALPASLRLSAKQEQAALLLAKGETQAETARQLGVAPQTVNRWLKEDAFVKRVHELRTNLIEQIQEKLEEAVPAAVDQVIRIAKEGGDAGVVSSQLKAALWILDRVLKSPKTGKKAAKPEEDQAFEGLQEEDWRELLGRGVDVAVNSSLPDQALEEW